MSYFTHLHVHTEFSLLDGAIAPDKLVAYGKKNNLPSLAITDHGNIFGAVKFFQLCQKAGIKPVLGMEAYITQDAGIKDINNKYYHILLLVKNDIGYKNLCKLIAYSYTDGFYFKPRIDYKILAAHAEGLIASSACLGGHIPSLLLQDRDAEAETFIDRHLTIFGSDNFVLEMQPEEQSEQKLVNDKIWDIGKRKGIPVIATCDSHYVSADDHEAHEVMLSIQTHQKITDADRYSFGNCRVHLRNCEEMLAIFPDKSDILAQTGALADRCNFTFPTGKLFFPQFEVPAQETQTSFFEKLCREGLEHLFKTGRIERAEEEIYKKRLELEIALIIKMGFVGYFLVVSDFIKWAKNAGIPVGPGRGSAAGSLVAWSLKITDIDPIKYNLLFERFLNPERISWPDIDIDFCIEGRDRVINYVREKYGHDKVCQIITFGTMMAKGVIKDVARVLGFPFEDSNAITDLIPDQLKITLQEAIDTEPRLKKLIEGNERVAKLFDLAFRLEGITRHASKHAAGIVISPEPITDVLPVYIPPKSNELVTQYAMTELEYLGFLKMDFLGLKNLTLIKRVVDSVAKNHAITIDPSLFPLDDEKTFALLSAGDTSGVFQLESDGIRDVLKRLQPHTFEDIIAVNALYRPGPLGSGMVDDFIRRKHGEQEIIYIFPELEPILKDTYGVIVYQEQVMKIASAVAGYSLGEADILRRAMGKKKAEEMAKQKPLFVDRAQKNNFDARKAGELFDLMAYFAGYGFNKSHSAAYALIAYQTAYLKAHHTGEFMACLISLEASDPEKMAFYLDEAKEHNIPVLSPDINRSDIDFCVENNALRFGLRGIRNVGSIALEQIVGERTKNGPFKNLFDLCTRVDLRTCNKRVLESLICAGACDQLSGNRAQKTAELEKIMAAACAKKKAALTGQMDLFSLVPTVAKNPDEAYVYAPCDEWSDQVKLEREKEVLGMYLTAQPLDRYKKHMRTIGAQPFSPILKPESFIIACGYIKSIKHITTKKGDRMAFVQCEDATEHAEIIVFPKLFARIESWLAAHTVFVIGGIVDAALSGQGKCKIKAQYMIPVDLVFTEGIGVPDVTVVLPDNYTQTMLEEIKNVLTDGKIKLSFIVRENGKTVRIKTRRSIAFSPAFHETIEKISADLRITLKEAF